MIDIANFKRLLGMDPADTSKDVPLQFAIEDTQDIILNYCNLSDLPQGLETTAYRMAMDLYRNEAPGEETTPLGSVSSISVGDTTTSFKSSASEFKDHLLKDYKAQLKRFRKVGFR